MEGCGYNLREQEKGGLVQLLEDRKTIIRLGGRPPSIDHSVVQSYLEEKKFRYVEQTEYATKFFINNKNAFAIVLSSTFPDDYLFVQCGKINRNIEDLIKTYAQYEKEYLLRETIISMIAKQTLGPFKFLDIQKRLEDTIKKERKSRKKVFRYNPLFDFEALEKLIQIYESKRSKERK